VARHKTLKATWKDNVGKKQDNILPLKMTVSSSSGISYAASTPGGSRGQNEDIKLKSAVLIAGCLRQKCLT